MTKHIDVSESYIKSILEQAAWKEADLTLEEGMEQEEISEEITEQEETIEEEVEGHTCPLCESVLEEEISDEKLLEHADLINQCLSEILEEEDLEENEKEGYNKEGKSGGSFDKKGKKKGMEESSDEPSKEELDKIGDEDNEEGAGKKGPSVMDLKAAHKKFKSKKK